MLMPEAVLQSKAAFANAPGWSVKLAPRLNPLNYRVAAGELIPGFPAGYRGGPGAMWTGELFPGRAGSFRELDGLRVTGDQLTPHHMPQAALRLTEYGDGGALMLPQEIHVLTRNYGTKGRILAQEEAELGFRSILYKDIKDVRKLTGSQYNAGLQDLLEYYRTNFPQLLTKP